MRREGYLSPNLERESRTDIYGIKLLLTKDKKTEMNFQKKKRTEMHM